MAAPTTVATRVRKNVWVEDAKKPFGETTAYYARAVAAMQARPATDPTSWIAQAAIHGSRTPGRTLRNECQHRSWFFLSWHRMYVYYFERIARKAVRDAGGPAGWSLPYWNYELGGDQATLPLAFRNVPFEGGRNPLFVPEPGRKPGINTGSTLPPDKTDSEPAMRLIPFIGLRGTSFGGLNSDPSHLGPEPGAMESQPHNSVHNLIGGLMMDFSTAGLDPIFWVHHANIDRLWDRWIDRGEGRKNPTEKKWLETPFTFYDEDGKTVRITGADIIDDAKQLGYRYDDASLPGTRNLRARLDMISTPPPPPPGPPEMLAATDGPVDLRGRAEVTVPVGAESAATIDRILDDVRSARRVLLTLDHVRAPADPGVLYEVHLNLPDDADPATEDSFLVGNLSFFGALPGESDDENNGISESFDITGLVEHLRSEGRWDASAVTVTFVPAGLAPPPGEEGSAYDVTPDGPASIAQVSIRSV